MALKTWGGTDWNKKLSDSTTACRADDDVGSSPDKPWFIYLAQTGDAPPVRTDLPGRHLLLLSQDEVKELVRWLLDSGMLIVDAEAETIEFGE